MSDNNTPITELSFEQGMAELETLVKKMETGEVKLAELVAFYERGIALKNHLETVLKSAQLKIEQVQSNGVISATTIQ